MTMHKKTSLHSILDRQAIYDHDEVTFDITPTTEELAALTERLGIIAVESLAAKVTIRRSSIRDLIKIEGSVTGQVTQPCVVTWNPVHEAIEASFSDTVTTNPDLLKPEEETDSDSSQPVDLIEGDTLDIGEIVTQWVSLALNPYPRSDTPLFEHIEDLNTEGTHKPFDVLGALKGKIQEKLG